MNEFDASPKFNPNDQPSGPTVVDPNPIVNPTYPNTPVKPVVEPILDHVGPIAEVQPGKLKSVPRHIVNGPAKLGSTVLFEGKVVAIVTGIWPDGTVNLTLFPDALPMLDVKTKVPLFKKGDITNTFNFIK